MNIIIIIIVITQINFSVPWCHICHK